MNRLLEEYVAEVRSGLYVLPAERREEETREIAQHLEAAVAAYEELGLSAAEAQAEAIRQFGAPRRISAGLRSAWRREDRRFLDSLLGAFIVATLAIVAAAGVSAACQAIPILFDKPGAAYVFWFRELPIGLTIGAFTAWIAPKRAIAGVVLAVVALCWFDLYMACVYQVRPDTSGSFFDPDGVLPRMLSQWLVHITTALLGACCLRARAIRRAIRS